MCRQCAGAAAHRRRRRTSCPRSGSTARSAGRPSPRRGRTGRRSARRSPARAPAARTAGRSRPGPARKSAAALAITRPSADRWNPGIAPVEHAARVLHLAMAHQVHDVVSAGLSLIARSAYPPGQRRSPAPPAPAARAQGRRAKRDWGQASRNRRLSGQDLRVPSPVGDHLPDRPQPRLGGGHVDLVEDGHRASSRDSASDSPTRVQSNCSSSSRPTRRTRSQTLSWLSTGRPRTAAEVSSMARTSRSARRIGSITSAGGNGCSRVDGGTRSARQRLARSRIRAVASPRPRPTRSRTSRSSARSRPFAV